MLPINPNVPAGLEGAAATAAIQVVKAAGGKSWRWWQFWRKFSASHKQGRMLYLELMQNLLLCRLAQRTHPPQLLLSRTEWSRPTTPALLAQLLDVREIVQVTAPYLMLEPYERLLKYPWVELLGVRLGGQDVAAVNTLADHFSEAEGVLRRKLYPEKGQRAIAQALDDAIAASAKTTSTNVRLRDRFYNATGSIPLGLKLAALMTIGGWNVARLLGWRSRMR